MNLILGRLFGIIPLDVHKVVTVGRIAEAGVKFGTRVSAGPRHKFLVDYGRLGRLQPQRMRVKVPPSAQRRTILPLKFRLKPPS